MVIQAVFAEPHGFGLNDDDLALANFSAHHQLEATH
jgi:hypothetical protein